MNNLTWGFDTYKAVFERGDMVHYNTVEEAAEATGCTNLAATLEKHNGHALAGEEDEWKRSKLPYLDTHDGIWVCGIEPTFYLTTGGLIDRHLLPRDQGRRHRYPRPVRRRRRVRLDRGERRQTVRHGLRRRHELRLYHGRDGRVRNRLARPRCGGELDVTRLAAIPKPGRRPRSRFPSLSRRTVRLAAPGTADRGIERKTPRILGGLAL